MPDETDVKAELARLMEAVEQAKTSKARAEERLATTLEALETGHKVKTLKAAIRLRDDLTAKRPALARKVDQGLHEIQSRFEW